MGKIDNSPKYGTSIMNLQYGVGDTVYCYDLADCKAFKGKVLRLYLPKKMEWRAILIIIEDDEGNVMKRSVDETIWVETSPTDLMRKVELHFRIKMQRAAEAAESGLLEKQSIEFC